MTKIVKLMTTLVVLMLLALPVCGALITSDEVKEWVGVRATQEYVYTIADSVLEYDGSIESWSLDAADIGWVDPFMDTESNWEAVSVDISAFDLGDYDLRALRVTADAANDDYALTLADTIEIDADDSTMLVYKTNAGNDDFELLIQGLDSAGSPVYLILKAGATAALTNTTSKTLPGDVATSFNTIDVPASATKWDMLQIPIAGIPIADSATWLTDGAGAAANFYVGTTGITVFASITTIELSLAAIGDTLTVLTIKNFEKEVAINTDTLDDQVNETYSTAVKTFTVTPNTGRIKKCIPTLTTNSYKGTITAVKAADYINGVLLTYKLDETPLPTAANVEVAASYAISGIAVNDLEAYDSYEVMEINVDELNEFTNTNGDIPEGVYAYTSGTATVEVEYYVSAISLAAQTALIAAMSPRVATYKWIGVAVLMLALWYGLKQYAGTTKTKRDDQPMFRWGLMLVVFALICHLLGIALAYVSVIGLLGAIMFTLAFFAVTGKR